MSCGPSVLLSKYSPPLFLGYFVASMFLREAAIAVVGCVLAALGFLLSVVSLAVPPLLNFKNALFKSNTEKPDSVLSHRPSSKSALSGTRGRSYEGRSPRRHRSTSHRAATSPSSSASSRQHQVSPVESAISEPVKSSVDAHQVLSASSDSYRHVASYPDAHVAFPVTTTQPSASTAGGHPVTDQTVVSSPSSCGHVNSPVTPPKRSCFPHPRKLKSSKRSTTLSPLDPPIERLDSTSRCLSLPCPSGRSSESKLPKRLASLRSLRSSTTKSPRRTLSLSPPGLRHQPSRCQKVSKELQYSGSGAHSPPTVARTRPYEAPYFFPPPGSFQAVGYVQKTREELRKDKNNL